MRLAAELENIDGFGSAVVSELASFFSIQSNVEAVDALIAVMEVQAVEAVTAQETALSGKSIVFTGTLQTMGRSEAKALAERLGAKVSGSVSKKTDFVVVGADAGSKAKKAQDLGLTILSEQDFKDLVAG